MDSGARTLYLPTFRSARQPWELLSFKSFLVRAHLTSFSTLSASHVKASLTIRSWAVLFCTSPSC